MKEKARSGFTLAEVLIASATGMTIVAATLSLYLFLSGEGRALRYQVEFNNKARVLQTAFEDLVEGNYCLLVDADNRGVSVYPNEAAMVGRSEADSFAEWIGYEDRPSPRQGSSTDPTERGTIRSASSATGSPRRIPANPSSTSSRDRPSRSAPTSATLPSRRANGT